MGARGQDFVERLVSDGRYGSASEVVREGLRPVEECEAKLVALRATLNASIAQGGDVTDEAFDADVSTKTAEPRSKGNGDVTYIARPSR